MAVRGGLTRFARPCGAARSRAHGLSRWLRQLSNPGRGFSSPPAGATCEKKARSCVHALISNMAVRGGLTRFARACGAARSRAHGLSRWLRQLSNPGRGFSSPRREPHAKKKPVLAYELFLKYGGEGGIDSLRSPLRGSPLAGSRSVQLAAPVVEPRSGVLIPPSGCHMRKKSPYLRTSSS